MDEEKPTNQLITLPIEYVQEICKEAEEQVSVSEELLSDFFTIPPENHNLVSMIVEILWSNYTILKIIDQEIETAVMRTNEKTGGQELICLESTINQLSQVLVTRYYANHILNSLSHSVSLH